MSSTMMTKEEPGTSSALLAGLEPHPRFSHSHNQPTEITDFVPQKLKGWLPVMSRRQWQLIAVFAVADFIAGVVYNIKGPFYPKEAEKKGLTSTDYGFVFGVFELTKVIICPFFGRFMMSLGPKRVFILATMLIGVCSICFGLLDEINNPTAFLTLSIIIRIFEAVGSAGFSTSSFTIIACEFPDSVATTFASLESLFGAGLIVGPLFGGLLFQVGGYPAPFIATGFVLFLLAFVMIRLMPQPETSQLEPETKKNGYTVFSILRIPGVMLAAFGVFAVASSAGFVNATLEPHIRQFTLTPVDTGAVFVIFGSVYSLTAPIWGYICDSISQPKLITLCGAVFNFIAFLLIGPAPFLPFDSILWVTCVGLVFHGLALGATFVSGFVLSLRYSVAHGAPNNMATYGLISGMWTSILSLGMFVGPSIGGILLDNVGFRWGSFYILVLMTILTVFIIIFLMKYGLSITKSEACERLLAENQPLITSVANSLDSSIARRGKSPSYGIASA